MNGSLNETVLTLGLAGVAIYFSVLVARSLGWYLFFRRLRPTALTTWTMRRPAFYRLLVGLGVLSAAVAVLSAVRERPLFHVYSQAVTALYFVLMVPLATRIRRGLFIQSQWRLDQPVLGDEGICRVGVLVRP